MVHGMGASILGAFRDLLSFLFSLWAVLLGCLYVDRYKFDVFKIISIFVVSIKKCTFPCVYEFHYLIPSCFTQSPVRMHSSVRGRTVSDRRPFTILHR